jgi:NADH-quinone oxidoreductase subunit G
VIDLCPVGALTSKHYEFKARPWELRKTETIDVMDAVGSNIRVDARGREVMRILPRSNDDVNEEWITDKSRFVWDGLKSQRLDRPYIREMGKVRPATWNEAFARIAEQVKKTTPDRIGVLMGDLNSVEEMYSLKTLAASLGIGNVDCRQDGSPLGEVGGRAGYIFNPGIVGIEKADAILLIGSNPRMEASVLNSRIRKAWRNRALPVGVIGERADLTYDYTYLGAGPDTLVELIEGRGDFIEKLKNAKAPLIIVGAGAVARPDGKAVLANAAKLAIACGAIKDDWNGFAVLHTAAGRVGGLDICALPALDGGRSTRQILEGARAGDIDFVYLLGADEIDMAALGGAFVVYQGTHGDAGAHRADVILPGAAYTEKAGTYVNTEGRVQFGFRACFPPGDAREDWAILRALSERLGKPLPYDTLEQVRTRLGQANRSFLAIDHQAAGAWGEFGKAGSVSDAPFVPPIANYYMTDPISRASRTMADCVASRQAMPVAAE